MGADLETHLVLDIGNRIKMRQDNFATILFAVLKVLAGALDLRVLKEPPVFEPMRVINSMIMQKQETVI